MKRSSNRSVATRLRALLLTLGLVLMGVVGVASPASAGTGDNYPSAWKTAAKDSVVDSWGYYNRECTSWAAWALHDRNSFEMPHAIGNGANWGVWASQHGYAVNNTPAVGAVAWWAAYTYDQGYNVGASGHVAWVSAVSGSTVTIEEYNYGNNGLYHTRTMAASNAQYIHFADVPTAGGETLWKLRNSNSEGPATAAFYYGPDTAKPVTGDWDGNGSVTIGVARNNGAGEIAWQLRNANSSGSPSATHTYGASTDTPVVGNWDGVGTTTIGIVRNDGSGQLMWKLSNDNGTPYASFYYGASTDIPVVGDWDGNGSVTIGIARRDATSDQLIWKLRNSNSAGVADLSFYYGASTAIPVTGDWNADGVTTIGTARKDDGSGELLWQLRNSNDAGTPSYAFHYGGSFDTPIVGDWDNSGTTTIGIARG